LHHHLCLCAELPVVRARTRVVLVLHQREQRRSSNTGRLAVRCLPNSIVVAHGRLESDAGLEREVVTGEPYPWQTATGACVVLAPRDDARPIEDWRHHPALTLIVPDGTWREAARARLRLPGLAALPSATVSAGPSLYALRHDPRPNRLGTLEALTRALGALEGEDVSAPLERILRVAFARTRQMRGDVGSRGDARD
jgi:DTW domain-containing protein YfiP